MHAAVSAGSAVRDVLRGFPETAKATAWGLATAWRQTRSAVVLSVASAVVLAVAPAVQVQAVAWLVRSSESLRDAAFPLLTLVFFIGAGQVLAAIDLFTRQRASLRLERSLQATLVGRVSGMSPAELADPAVSADVQISRDSLRELAMLPWSAISAMSAVLAFGGLFVSVWFISPLAAGLIVAAIIPSLVIFAWASSRQAAIFGEVGAEHRRVTYLVEQLVSQRTGVEIASFGSGGRLVRQISERQLRAHTLLDRLLVGIIRGSAWGGLAGTALLAGALTAIVVDGAGGAGIAAGVLGVLGGIEATRGAAFALGDVLAATPRVSTFRRVTGPDAAGPPPRASVVSAVDRLEASGVSVVYPRATATALNDASVLARRGEMIALVGANGAGKTTLVRALVGLVRVSSGAVLLDGRRLTDLPLTERLSHFGLLTQEFGRYELTVRQAVLLGLPEGIDVADDAIWRALEIAHLAGLVADLPDGLDTQLGEQFGGTGLSGGQWQRLALARIAVRNAGIWILDEPTSTVDAETEREIFGELLQHRRHRITIVVSHRAWTLKGMDRIYVLDGGRIVQCGSYEELLGTQGRFRELFAEQ